MLFALGPDPFTCDLLAVWSHVAPYPWRNQDDVDFVVNHCKHIGVSLPCHTLQRARTRPVSRVEIVGP